MKEVLESKEKREGEMVEGVGGIEGRKEEENERESWRY